MAKRKRTARPKKRSGLTKAERDRRLDVARRAADTRRRSARGLVNRLVAALEFAQDLARREGYPSVLATASPAGKNEYSPEDVNTEAGRRNDKGEFAWRAPWAIVGRVTFRPAISYAALSVVLNAWTSAQLGRRINEDRLARMRVGYTTAVGEQGDYILAETLAWQFVIARAFEAVDPELSDSLASRYESSLVTSVWIWLATDLQRGASGRVTLRRRSRR